MKDDSVSRAAVLILIAQSCCDLEYDCDNVALRKEVEALPSAQPEIIHCKDCKFFSHGYCRFHDAKFVRPDGYCYWGEQKEGERHDGQGTEGRT